MPNWTCPATKAPCKQTMTLPVYDDEQKKKHAGWCPPCKSKLVEAPGKAEDEEKKETFVDTLVRTVTAAREGAQEADPKHYAAYVKFVLDDVLNLPKVFQDDFLREWKTGEVQIKLYDPSKRLAGKSVDCVQQAVAAANQSWPDGIPLGEKFQFELPYIIGTGLEWKIEGDIANAYKYLLKTMKVAANRLYLVSAQSAATGAVEGHMILIVSDAAAATFLVDFQNQKKASRALGCLNHYYCAWSVAFPTGFKVPKGAMDIKLG